MRRRLVIHAACACVLFALACAGSSPSSAVESFYDAIGEGKTDDALGLLSERTVATIGKDKLRAGLQNASRKALDKGGIKEVRITDEQVASEIANVTAVVTYGNGTTESEKVKLVKEGAGWRLQPDK